VDDEERSQLIAAYMAYAQAPRHSAQQNMLSWAWERFDDLARSYPLVCLQLCEEMLEYMPDDKVMALLAAGPLEDVLARHGPAVIEEVETRARRLPRFRHLLGGVWKNAMTDEVWDRVCKARGKVW
jgi:hypothetical protein